MRVESRGVAWDAGRRARVYSIIGRAIAVLGIVFTLLPAELAAVGALEAVLGMFVMMIGFVASLETPRERPGEVHVDDAGGVLVRIGKKSLMFARAKITGAWVTRRVVSMREYYWVEISTRPGTTIAVRVPTLAEARGVVEELGFGPFGRAAKIPLAKRSRRVLHLALAAVAYLASIFAPWLAGPAMLLVVFAVVYELLRFAFRPPVLDIGSDALQVRIGPRKVRVPRSDIARVSSPTAGSIVIERKNGSKLRIRGVALDPARVAAAAALIDERLGDRPAHVRANAFERGGRGLAEWRAALRTNFDPTYRSTGASIEDATDVLASPSSTVEQRVGAALALRVAGEPLERVRIAAEGTVDGKVRVVLDAIADGADDEALDETLRRMAR